MNKKPRPLDLLLQARVESKIFFIRGRRVMLDRDLAELYEVPTKVFNQAVKRNKERFPDDFMFQLSKEETQEFSRSQFVTLKQGYNVKYLPYVFTEHGVAMLSGVLNSKRAIEVNIRIIRTFIKLREILLTNKELREKIELVEKEHNGKFLKVFIVINQLSKKLNWLLEDKKEGGEVGFKIKGDKEKK